MSLGILELPTVTLACIETRNHELMRLTLDDAIKKVSFQDVVVMTDKPHLFKGYSTTKIDDASNKLGWEKQRWIDLPEVITTNHMLFMEWDAGIYLPGYWDQDYLSYDYIGAPWWYTDAWNVGNGGFTLRSQELNQFLARHIDTFPCLEPGDEVLCRRYRPTLEIHGFKWPSNELAHQFAFECSPPHNTFGFHAMRNWPHVLQPDEVEKRYRLAADDPYIRKTGMLSQLEAKVPHLAFN